MALQSTVAKLISAFPATTEQGSEGELRVQDVSTVTYLDYRSDGPDLSFTSGPYIIKRASFAHEKEIRAVLQILPTIPKALGKRAINLSAPDGSPGIRQAIVPAAFLDAIYISPSAPTWHSNLLVALLKKYDLQHLGLSKSSLQDEPFF
ncbi:MAG TPA: hypothetical protein VOA80_16130 [Thermoanaerobaculia bacterium]|nr:hypothetical protein [Thermoanaerobaculia bacterium]